MKSGKVRQFEFMIPNLGVMLYLQEGVEDLLAFSCPCCFFLGWVAHKYSNLRVGEGGEIVKQAGGAFALFTNS
jgi:hypothetical protein